MGRVAYQSRASGSQCLFAGGIIGPHGRAIRPGAGFPDHTRSGRPVFLPVPVPLDLMAG